MFPYFEYLFIPMNEQTKKKLNHQGSFTDYIKMQIAELVCNLPYEKLAGTSLFLNPTKDLKIRIAFPQMQNKTLEITIN